jgi:Asp-tRNA(Asn)/Glu-tRNA(Gln) amidotransferase A subunit family amidase
MHELGAGPTGRNPVWGTPPNPYHVAHYPGGSSSGSAVAVAAGLAPLAVGCDGGGSIRLPASFSGLVGLKATFGRISRAGAAPIAWSVTHTGPLAWSAVDCALGYLAMAGRDVDDPTSLTQPPPTLDRFFDDDLSGVRLGVYRPWFEDAEPAVVAACKKMLDHFVARGARIVDVEVADLELARVVHLLTLGVEAAATQTRYRDLHRAHTSPEVRLGLSVVQALTAADYVRMQSFRADINESFFALFRHVDAVVTPTSATTAPKMRVPPKARAGSDLAMLSDTLRYTPLANLTGGPAISFVAGYDPSGLPIGFHAMADAYDEALLLRLARIAETAVPRTRPMRSVSLL